MEICIKATQSCLYCLLSLHLDFPSYVLAGVQCTFLKPKSWNPCIHQFTHLQTPHCFSPSITIYRHTYANIVNTICMCVGARLSAVNTAFTFHDKIIISCIMYLTCITLSSLHLNYFKSTFSEYHCFMLHRWIYVRQTKGLELCQHLTQCQPTFPTYSPILTFSISEM